MSDLRPLSSGLAGCCKTARLGGGLPAGDWGGLTTRPFLPSDVVRLIDTLARRLEREERLRSMNRGVLGWTLADAARAGGLRDVRFLLAVGAEANYGNSGALLAAASLGHAAIVAALLDSVLIHGCSAAEDLGDACAQAALAGHADVVALLLDSGRVDVHYLDDRALLWAALMGQGETVQLLLERGADVRRPSEGLALAWAMENGHDGVADVLASFM